MEWSVGHKHDSYTLISIKI